MSLFKPDPPTPPNPIETARASTSTNVATGVANAYLNNVNQVTPQGSLNYNATGSHSWHDPVTNTDYEIPTFTATQTLTPQQQAIQAQNEAAQYNLSGMANAQSGRISGLLSQNMDTSTPINTQAYLQAMDPSGREWGKQLMAQGMSADDFVKMHYQQAQRTGDYRTAGVLSGGDPSSITNVGKASTSFDAGGPIQNTFGGYGDITRTYGPADNFSADRQRVEDSLMQRMNPQLSAERQSVEQRLADQGIRYGSQAYSSAMDDYNRQANDARFAAIGQAGGEQQRMNQMAAQLAAFQNQAQGQGYEQAQGLAQFGNQAQGQQFTQNAALEAFRNAGLAQQISQAQSGFNAQQAARNSWMQEQYAQRNQPINEISSLLSGSQVSQPNFVNTPGSQIATTDIGGLVNQNFQNQMQAYGQQSQNANTLIGGVLGAGAGLIRSDERVKNVGDRIGTVFATNEDDERKKLPVYEYAYKDDPAATRHIGPMAQDVEKVDRKAVKTIGGVKHLDTRRVMGNILRAA